MRKLGVNVALSSLMLMLLLMAARLFGPMVETAFFPVYSRFILESAMPLPSGESEVVFNFQKLRTCQPRGYAWFNGELGNFSEKLDVRVRPNLPSPRPLGWQRTSPYIIEATPDEVRNAVSGEIYSECHPFWITRSVVY